MDLSYFKGRTEDLATDCIRKFSKAGNPGRLIVGLTVERKKREVVFRVGWTKSALWTR